MIFRAQMKWVALCWAKNTSPNLPLPSFLPKLKSASLTLEFLCSFSFRLFTFLSEDPTELFLNFEKLELWLLGVSKLTLC